MSTVRSLILPLLASIALWCSAGISNTTDTSELNLEDGISDGFASYWNTFYCQVYPLDPTCASGALNPYYGPAWYNFNYGGFGFDDRRSHTHRGGGHHKRNGGCRGGCGGRGR